MDRINLNGEWDATGISPDGEKINLCATVPGSTLNDVLKNENITDVFWRDNAEQVQKYENYNWIYTKKFSCDTDFVNAELVFSKLDTYCSVQLNGKHLGSCDNGHISHKFDVSDMLLNGENTLEVFFTSPITETKDKLPLKGAFTTERMYTRRTQCTYGWDWTMRFVTCGIGDAYIRFCDNSMQVKSAYVYTIGVDDESASVGIDVDYINYNNGAMTEIVICDNENKVVYSKTRYCEEEFSRTVIDIENPKLWYPNGYGEQPLYTLIVKLDGEESYRTVFGIRTVKIQQLKDKPGSAEHEKSQWLKKSVYAKDYEKNEESSGFILKINGVKIMCKGGNWVPTEPFATGDTSDKITRTLELSEAAGVNMIRVWGGGTFESEHFYDECSRLGILVTQDFLMACGRYPENEQWFLDQLKKEAEYAAELLRNKACLVWWTGDNENAVNGCDTDTDYMGRKSAYKAIAPVLYEKDRYRMFLPSSPYGGSSYASNTVGTTHNTQYLDDFFKYIETPDLSDYKEQFKMLTARFVAEDTCFGAVSLPSLKKFMTDDDIYGDDLSMWLYHTKGNPGLKRELFDYINEFTEKVFGKYTDGHDRYFKFKYMQYEWIRVTLERARRDKWFCAGNIYWMLNDCWPAASGWAMIDYYNLPKAGYYSFKRAAKPVIVSMDFEDGKYNIYACNDSKVQELDLKWHIVSSSGDVKYTSETKAISAPENETKSVTILENVNLRDDGFIIADIMTKNGEVVDRTFYKHGTLPVVLCNDRLEIVEKTSDSVTVKAKKYIHSVEIEADAVFEDNYFSMLPGEKRKIGFEKNSDDFVLGITAYTL